MTKITQLKREKRKNCQNLHKNLSNLLLLFLLLSTKSIKSSLWLYCLTLFFSVHLQCFESFNKLWHFFIVLVVRLNNGKNIQIQSRNLSLKHHHEGSVSDWLGLRCACAKVRALFMLTSAISREIFRNPEYHDEIRAEPSSIEYLHTMYYLATKEAPIC